MDTTKFAAWLGHPAHLTLGLVMLAVDIVTAASWIAGAAGILSSWELHLGLLVVCTPLAVLFLWAWIATHPRRPSERFKALHDDLVACRDRLGPNEPTDRITLQVTALMSELQQQLKRLGVTLRIYDPYDATERRKCWSTLTALASYAKVGDLKAARSIRDL